MTSTPDGVEVGRVAVLPEPRDLYGGPDFERNGDATVVVLTFP